MQIDAQTRLIGLLGYPLRHTFSPRLHNAALQAQGINARYVALPVLPEQLAEAVAGLRALGFWGANVTIPHKQAVLPLLDALSPQAEAVGAVNTIVCQRQADGTVRLYGDNTDVAGFLAPLSPFLPHLQGAAVAIFGAGGAARAVAYALLTTCEPSRLALIVRNVLAAEKLASDLARFDRTAACGVVPANEAGSVVAQSRLLVNATPLGTAPDTDTTPWPYASEFAEGVIAYDLVYNPPRTRFLREAAPLATACLDGRAMLIAQAAASYRQWTGQEMPLEVVKELI